MEGYELALKFGPSLVGGIFIGGFFGGYGMKCGWGLIKTMIIAGCFGGLWGGFWIGFLSMFIK